MSNDKGQYGLGRVFKRGKIWWVKYHRDGRPYRESSKSARRRDAVALLKQRLTEIGTGTFVAPSRDKFRFADAVELMRADYRNRSRKSWDRARRSIRHLEQVFDGDQLAHITTERIDRYVEQRFADGAARATIQNELAALKRLFALAQERRKVTTRPAFPSFGDLKNARKEFIEDDDLVALLAENALLRPGEYNPTQYDPAVGHRMIVATHRLGWRWNSEVRPLTWDRFDLDRETIELDRPDTKGGDDRPYPFGADPELRAAILEQRAYTDEIEQELGRTIPYVWHVRGRHFRTRRDKVNPKGKAPVPGAFYNIWEMLCKRAGVLGKDGKHKRLHDHRRSGVRRLERSGVSREVAKRLIGHKTDSMYARYNIVTDDDLRAGVAKAAADSVAMSQRSRQTNQKTSEPVEVDA